MPGISGTVSWKPSFGSPGPDGAAGHPRHVVGLDAGDEHGAALRLGQPGQGMVSLYTDDKAAVTGAIQRSSQKLAALDLRSDRRKAEEAQRRRIEEHRQHQHRLAFITRRRAANDNQHRQPERQMSHGYER